MLKLFKVIFNDRGWHSGDLPSELVIAENKEEAIIKAKQKRIRYNKGWDIFANEVKIDIDVTREKTEIRYLLGRKYSKSYSGTLWDEDCLFKTVEEAEVECEKRNKELELE